MNKLRTYCVLMIAVGSLTLGACATVNPLPASFKTSDTKLGKVLADNKGMTLYTFDKDVPGKSNCKGKCAISRNMSDGNWTTLARCRRRRWTTIGIRMASRPAKKAGTRKLSGISGPCCASFRG